MRNWLKRLQIKGFVTGVLVTVLLSGTMMVVAAQTVTRNITYGVRVSLNGQVMQFDDESQPFVMEGRTFLPVRAIAEALGLAVDFDGAQNMVLLGDPHAGARRPLQSAAPFFDNGIIGNTAIGTQPARTENSVVMSGVTYNNVIVYGGSSMSHMQTTNGTFTLHNLGGAHRMLTGYIGRVDGSGQRDAVVNFYGDGNLLQSYTLSATAMPTAISVFVEGVQQLRVEVVFESGVSPRANYALAAYLE